MTVLNVEFAGAGIVQEWWSLTIGALVTGLAVSAFFPRLFYYGEWPP